MVNVRFFPIDIDTNKEGIIRLFGKTVDGKRVCVLDKEFNPFFYVIPEGDTQIFQKQIDSLVIEDEDEKYKVVKTKIVEKKYCNEKLEAVKVYVNSPTALKVFREDFKQDGIVLEHDIDLVKKYLVERGITPLRLSLVEGEKRDHEDLDLCVVGKVSQDEGAFYNQPRILAIDIEVYGAAGGEDKVKKDPIIMIGFYGDGFEKVVTWKKVIGDYIEIVDSEAALISRFVDVIKEYQPDYLVTYYGDGFDLPYIRSRAERYKIRMDMGLDRKGIRFKRGGLSGTSRISGIPHIDIFKFIRKTMATTLKLDSYSLDYVAKELLGQRKEDMDVEMINIAWDAGNLDKLASYNLQDAKLTFQLFNKVLPNLNELVRLIGMPIFEVSRMGHGTLVENYLIKRAKEFGVMMPNKPRYTEIASRREESYQGAFVMEPKPGLYRDVVVVDYRSLYPSLIIAKNIDPGMLQDSKEDAFATPEVDIDGQKVKYFFNYKEEGFIPGIMKELILRRNRIKEMLKNEKSTVLKARSQCLKDIANSCYGMYGFFGARYYSKECASSITAFARNYIQDTINKAGKEGFLVIYSDTDSIAMSLEGKKKREALTFLENVNRELPSLMELELEDFYPLGIFVSKKGDSQGAKKKYALINGEDEIKVVGFETVRRDWSLIARETQMKVLELILKSGSYEKALSFVRNVIDNIKDKKIPIKKMIIGTQIKRKLSDYVNVGPHVAAARKMKNKGIDVSPGTTVFFVVGEGEGVIRDRVKLPEECDDKDYDSGYYINNQVIPSVEKIFEIFDVKKEDLFDKDQSTLWEF